MALIFQENKLLKTLTTIGIGGFARYFVEVKTVEEMQEAIKHCLCNGLDYLVLGKGSNTLFDDKGFDGVVILNKIDFFETVEDGVFHVGAGYSFSRLGAKTAREGWAGLEFASGIPGSVGGAVFMNAGANGHEVCEVLVSVDYIDDYGERCCLKNQDLKFSYRSSSFQTLRGAIVGATFALKSCVEARKRQLEIVDYRTKTQPYSEMSAGCIFRNPVCNHAGELIEKSGLKGCNVGGAKVSDLHANFIVNSAEASCQDVLELVEVVRARVKEKWQVDLESEVRYIPYNREEI